MPKISAPTKYNEIAIYNMYLNVFQCYIFLDDAQSVAEVLEKLVKADEVGWFMYLKKNHSWKNSK